MVTQSGNVGRHRLRRAAAGIPPWARQAPKRELRWTPTVSSSITRRRWCACGTSTGTCTGLR